jgi:nucleotide-binding universal stress UspA family protein
VPAPFTEVLVPLDGSPTSERALVPALELVGRTGAPLRILTRVLPGEEDGSVRYLADLADRYPAAAAVEREIVSGTTIPDAIAGGLAPGSLVCMSSHGRGGLARAVIGSVAEDLLRRLDRPTLVIGPQVDVDAGVSGRIVACVDGSDASERTLPPAQRWSEALGLPLWLVEVCDPDGEPPGPEARGDVAEGGYVAGLAQRVGAEGWDVLHDRDAAAALTDMAGSARPPTAMLVMATHGRTGWDRMRLGSVTTAAIRSSGVPVLVVPADPGADESVAGD